MRIPLIQGAYRARGIIASAQRSVNLISETNPQGAIIDLDGAAVGGLQGQVAARSGAVPLTYYPAPGLSLLGTPPFAGPARGLFAANSGDLYYVVGADVYYVSAGWTFVKIGTIAYGTTPVSMMDNGTTLVLVDGTVDGYQIDLTSRAFSRISEATNSPPSPNVYAFYGADRVDAIDGYLLFNQPGTRNFYSTYLNEIVFDSTYFAAKNAYSDNLVTLITCIRQIYLLGERTTEVWFDAGDVNFPFQIVPGPFIQHGCSAKYSVAQVDGQIYFLSQDQAGNNILMRIKGYDATVVSTRALEFEWSQYTKTSDAVGFCFQQNGHPYYQINFPSADKSFRYDESTNEWHECVYLDSDGGEHRHRAQCVAYAYGQVVAGDWLNGSLYAIRSDTYTDNGQPMVWRRSFPHMMNDGKRVNYVSFIADVQPGETTGFPWTPRNPNPTTVGEWGGFTVGLSPVGDASYVQDQPLINLRWSDDRGRTFGNPIQQQMGATGKYQTQPKWWRLGMARDRVFEIYGTIPGPFALNGAFIEVTGSGT